MTDGWQVTPGPDDQGEAAFVEEVLRDNPELGRKISRDLQDAFGAAAGRCPECWYWEPNHMHYCS